MGKRNRINERRERERNKKEKKGNENQRGKRVDEVRREREDFVRARTGGGC